LQVAADLLTPACDGFGLHATMALQAADCWGELAKLEGDLGRRDLALQSMMRALRAGVFSGTYTFEQAPYALLWSGHAAEAARQFEEALSRFTGEDLQSRRWRAAIGLGLGRALRAKGELAAARRALESSVSIFSAVAADHPTPMMERDLGRARCELARVMAAMGVRGAEVAAVAEAGAAWLQAAGGPPDEIRELREIAAR